MTDWNTYRLKLLDLLGGPIKPGDMQKQPTNIEWLRYWLYRIDLRDAIVNAENLSGKAKPKEDWGEIIAL